MQHNIQLTPLINMNTEASLSKQHAGFGLHEATRRFLAVPVGNPNYAIHPRVIINSPTLVVYP